MKQGMFKKNTHTRNVRWKNKIRINVLGPCDLVLPNYFFCLFNFAFFREFLESFLLEF